MPIAIQGAPGALSGVEFESGVVIAASALVLLGAAPIGSMLENNTNARKCARFYPESRREVLEMHTWNCATKRKALARDAVGPVFGWSYSFTLPVTHVRVVATSLDRDEGGDGDPWAIELGQDGSKVLVCNVPDVKIKYIDDVTNAQLFDPLLEKAIRYSLAAKLAYPVAQNTTLQELYEGLSQKFVSQAKGYDGQQQSKQRMRSTMLTDVRR
jgi:hypothetical protein